MTSAAVLLSGGLDSAVTLAVAASQGYTCHCLTVDYGQRHRIEIQSAARVARHLKAGSHRTVRADLSALGGSALTTDIDVPKDREPNAEQVPLTYVPARNTILLSLLLALAETLGARHLFIGATAVDYSGYPDCRPEFVRAFEDLARLATRAGTEAHARFHVRAPLLHLGKAQIIRLGTDLGVDFALTHSCYDPSPDGLACGSCEACRLRRDGFSTAGVPDPTRYAE